MPVEKDINIKNKDIMSFKNIKSLNTKIKFLFCYKKTSRILKAIYILTDNTSNSFNQDIKDNLRLMGQKIVKGTIDLFTNWNIVTKNELEGNILYTISIIDVASATRIINEINANILGEEYEKILGVIEGINSSETNVFEENNLINLEKTIDIGLLPKELKKPIKRTEGLQGKRLQIGEKFEKGQEQDYKRQKEPSTQKVKQNDREKIIIDEIKKKKIVTIKDISVIMPSVSEKTVQRELISMVERGVLKKEGERRWSKYLLVQVDTIAE